MPSLGRRLFALSISAFGIEYLIHGRFVRGLPPVPPWAPGGAFLAYPLGVLLIVASVCIATTVYARGAAILLGALFFLCVMLLHGLRANAVFHNGDTRTGALEALALSGAAWVLAGALPTNPAHSYSGPGTTGTLSKLGLFLFAFSMAIFGIQHFMYDSYTAGLVPSWIPGHLF